MFTHPKMDAPKVNKLNSQALIVLETTFAITAFFLMSIGTLHCDFIKFTDTSGTSQPISLKFGIWYYQFWSYIVSTDGTFIFESCSHYPDYIDIDGGWKAARAFSVLAFVLAIIVLIVVVVSACTSEGKMTTRGWMAPMYILTCLCQGLTLLLLNSNACKNNQLIQGIDAIQMKGISFPDTCSLARGGNFVISATVFWFAAGLASFTAHRTEMTEKAEAEEVGHGILREPLVGP